MPEFKEPIQPGHLTRYTLSLNNKMAAALRVHSEWFIL